MSRAMNQTSERPVDVTTRRVPPFGGFNLTMLGIELRRGLRNRRAIVFSLVLPSFMYLVIGGTTTDWNDPAGKGNIAAYILVSMALYGASLTAAAGGSMVATERAMGWSRQLRLTPLSPLVYIIVKALVALTLGALAIAVVNLVGVIHGRPEMPVGIWISCAVTTLVCTFTFAALGVFIGYLVPGENVMQILGPGLALLSFLGGVFIPLTEGSTIWHIAVFTPMYGVAEVSRAPLTGELPWYAVANTAIWLAIFIAGAAWRMSKDTERV